MDYFADEDLKFQQINKRNKTSNHLFIINVKK